MVTVVVITTCTCACMLQIRARPSYLKPSTLAESVTRPIGFRKKSASILSGDITSGEGFSWCSTVPPTTRRSSAPN